MSTLATRNDCSRNCLPRTMMSGKRFSRFFYRDRNSRPNWPSMIFGKSHMVQAAQIAEAANARDAMRLRSLIQDWLTENPRLSELPKPNLADSTLLSIFAAIVELLAQRRNQPPPSWACGIGPVPHRIYLVKAAEQMPRLRRLCETESPLPLRQRNLLAPPSFLEFA
jgi:hypothetical protein